MKNVLEEYRLAVEENIRTAKLEVDIREQRRAAHYKLLKAKEMLKNTTDELLEDTLVNRSLVTGYCVNRFGTCEPDEKCDCNWDLSNNKTITQ